MRIPEYNVREMKRYAVVAIALVLAISFGAAVLSVFDRPSEVDYRLARGRALLDAENYLGVLETLRDLPANRAKGLETHSYLGAAYLKLHLYKAAIQEFEEALKLNQRSVDPQIGLASAYIQLGDAAKAVDAATRGTEIEKRSIDAWIGLGRSQWQQQNFAEAEKAALKAREIDTQNPAVSELLLHIYFDQNHPERFQTELDRNANPPQDIQDLAVRFFIRQGQFARAADLTSRYERAALERSIFESELGLKREPERSELYPPLIRNLVSVGRFQEAIDAGKKYRGSLSVDIELGKAFWMTGGKDDAIQSFQRASGGLVHKLPAEIALAVITGDIRHWQEAFRSERPEQDRFMLARLEDVLPNAKPMIRAFIYRYAALFDVSFYNNAAEEALKVLDQDPNNFDALMTISTAYQRIGRSDDALRYLERARESYPRNAEPLSRLANLLLAAEEKDVLKIVGLQEQAVKMEPTNAGYLYNLGWMYDQTGDTAKAIDLYERAIRASRISFEAMNNLALLYGNSDQEDRALALLQQAIRTDPENEAGYFNIANYYIHRHDWRQALDNYQRILSLNPANAVAAVESGRIDLELGNTGDAVENLNHALDIDPHSFDAYMLLSTAYEKMGHTKEAIAAAEEAQRIRPGASEVSAALDRLNAELKAHSATKEKDAHK